MLLIEEVSLKVSTGLADYLADGGSLKAAFDGGLLKAYYIAGDPPLSANEAVTGTLVWTISKTGDGTGLTFEGRDGERGVFKPAADVWSGPTTASPAPNYWRLVATGDDGTASTTQKRLQGSAGTSPTAELQLSDTAFTTDASPTARALSRFGVVIPVGVY